MYGEIEHVNNNSIDKIKIKTIDWQKQRLRIVQQKTLMGKKYADVWEIGMEVQKEGQGMPWYDMVWYDMI